MKLKKYTEAKRKITEILDNPAYEDYFTFDIVSKLFLDRATANFETRNYREAIKDATSAMKVNSLRSECLKIRADSYMAMRNFQSAVNDYEELLKLGRTNKMEETLDGAIRALQRFQSDNYYDILELQKTATTSDILTAYLRLASIHRPENHADAPESERQEQEKILERINTARATLMDPEKRLKYDRSILPLALTQF